MKHFASFALLVSLSAVFAAACGSSAPTNPLTSGTGAGSGTGSGVTSGSNTTGAGGATGSGGSTGSNTTTGGGCKQGGAACQGFNECCSGVCADQTCTTCGAKDQPCGEGCCVGLTCYNNKCGSCQGDNTQCALASDCCSNVCDQGTCAHCGGAGESCGPGGKCCTGLQCNVDGACCAKVGTACGGPSDCCEGSTCTNGTCSTCKQDGVSCTKAGDCCSGTCQSGKCGVCEGPTCADAAQGAASSADLCGPALDFFNTLFDCVCSGACKSACDATICSGIQGSDPCFTCISDVDVGCGNQLNDCLAN